VLGLACSQPKQINEIKDFLLTARRKDAKCTLPANATNLPVLRGLRSVACMPERDGKRISAALC
jgi:hypothetical protein